MSRRLPIAMHRATYAGDAHMSASDRDLTAAKIALYLKPSGDELDRVEAYDAVTFRDQNRKITGAHRLAISCESTGTCFA